VDLSCEEEEGATPFQSDRDPQGVWKISESILSQL
jgi:hypothetical protein